MQYMKTVAAFVCLGLAAEVQSQACHSPHPIFEHTDNPGDTCTSGDWWPWLGPIPSPHRDVIYHFEAWDANVTIRFTLEGDMSMFPEASAFLMSSPCGAGEPIKFGNLMSPIVIEPGELTVSDDYFVVVTADPASLPGTCGAYNLRAEVQYHDAIFASGFE